VLHEVQYTANTSLRRWVLWKRHLENKKSEDSKFEDAAAVLDQVLGLEVEGLATYLSGVLPERLSSKHIRKFKELVGGYQSTIVYILEDVCPLYPMGYQMYKMIKKAGFNAINVGFGMTPMGFLKKYEEACSRLHINPIVTTDYIAKIYGSIFTRKKVRVKC
jgi:hypothetical protein